MPSTPTPGDNESLLPPSSPDVNSVPRILHPSHSPMRTITPLASTAEHPLKTDFLSPPARKSSKGPKRPAPPAVTQIDLPTRADVQAAQAVARAEASGLRGGWVMNLDTSVGSAHRRTLSPTHRVSPSMDAEMVDIDLEGGRQESFGTAAMTAQELEKQREEDRLSMAGVEHRRDSRSPVLLGSSRSPSPLAVNPSAEVPAQDTARSSPSSVSTQKGPGSRVQSPVSASGSQSPSFANLASSSVRRPPPVGAFSESPRILSPSETEREVIRGPEARRRSSAIAPPPLSRENSLPIRSMSRENSMRSSDSHDVLLAPATPPIGSDSPPSKLNGNSGAAAFTDEPKSVVNDNDLVDGLEEVHL